VSRLAQHRWLLILGGIVLVLALLAVFVLVFQPDLLPDNGPTPEQTAADAARSTGPVSPAGPAAAASLGTGGTISGAWYELAFTAPKYPDNPANHQGGPDELLVGLVNRTQRTLDLAVYDFDLQNVADAMARAAQRGVQVRMVTDSDTLHNTKDRAVQAAFDRVRAGNIPVVEDNRRPIMHNKFAVADGEWVLTGSWNFTDGDTYHLNNNAILVQSRALAANYATEFEKMFGRRQFGGAKTAGVPNPVVTLAGSRVENYFCPKDNCAAQVIRWVTSAQQRIHFLAFSFTHDGIGDAMMQRARAGAELGGVFETTGSETRFSEFGRMKQAGFDVLQDGNPWVMHHKVILLDDHVTVFGSFNFSSNADHDNDENLLIVDDPSLAAAFEAEYQRVRAVALNPPVRR
jgi:phosphatidylserine/phosphatidylglycerophosphate/cardiolipin synthase-like enzyme